MIESDDQWAQLVEGMRNGDETACHDFWKSYGSLIERVAQKHLSPGIRRRVGPETIASSVCLTFLKRVKRGEFDLPNPDSLANLLCVITANKVRMKVRHHTRQKRSLRDEVYPERGADLAKSSWTPEDESIFAEEYETLIDSFSKREHEILELWLEGLEKEAIADKVSCSERTIRRTLNRVEERLREMFA